MAYIGTDGLIVAEPGKGDVLRMVYVLKAKDYGRYDAVPPVNSRERPTIGIHHCTDSALAYGEDATDMILLGERVCAALKQRPWHAQVYVGRDGACVQINPASRAVPGTEGSCLYLGKKHENNNLGFQIEWHSLACVDLQGRKWAVNQEGRRYVSYQTNPNRADLRRDGKLLWQTVTEAQVKAVGEICRAVVGWSGMLPSNMLHGHRELIKRGHGDPGPWIIEALHTIGVNYLGLPSGFTVPAGNYQPYPITIPAPAGTAVAKLSDEQQQTEFMDAIEKRPVQYQYGPGDEYNCPPDTEEG